jgi:polyisoprenoid-binding protein YceI
MLQRLVLLLVLLPGSALAVPWQLDPDTTVTVDVPWQGRTVEVRFPQLSGKIDFDADHPDRAKATISVSSGEATTGVGVVDALVRSHDFLGAEQYPAITFRLDKLTQTSKSDADVAGRITMRGVTKPIAFKAVVFSYGAQKDHPDGFEAGFNLTGSIDRTEFGSTGGLPDVGAVLPVRIRLRMSSQ